MNSEMFHQWPDGSMRNSKPKAISTKLLRWEEQSSGGWFAYSGEIIVGMIVRIAEGPRAGQWSWSLSMAGNGKVRSAEQARKSLECAWKAWLSLARLRAE